MSNNLIIVKSTELNEANYGDFTLNTYQVLLHVIGKLEQAWIKDSSWWDSPTNQTSVLLKAKEFADLFKCDVHNAYGVLKEAAIKLVHTAITFKGRDKRGNFTTIINACSSATYFDLTSLDNNAGTISVTFTNEIMKHLSKLKNRFIAYQAASISGFGSYYSLRLFELLANKQSFGILEISLQDFKHAMGCSGEGYDSFGSINQSVIKPSLAEIKKVHSLTVNYELIKTGRKVSGITFKFKKDFAKKLNKADVIKKEQDKINETVNKMFNASGATK